MKKKITLSEEELSNLIINIIKEDKDDKVNKLMATMFNGLLAIDKEYSKSLFDCIKKNAKVHNITINPQVIIPSAPGLIKPSSSPTGLVKEQDVDDEQKVYGDDSDKWEQLKKRIGVFFSFLKSLGEDVFQYWEDVKTKGALNHQGNHMYGSRTYNELVTGLKISALDNPIQTKGGMGTTEVIYALLTNFYHNGGRNWNKGDEIELVPAYSYSIDVEFEEDVIEYGRLFLDIHTPNQEAAEKMALENPWDYEVDRETDDHDYSGDHRNLEIYDVQKNEWYLSPEMFGIN